MKRNFQIISPLDFLCELTRHITTKGSHLTRYFGWYSNKSRGMRKKAAAEASAERSSKSGDAASAAASRCSQSWAMLMKRVYEVDPFCCPECGGQMNVVHRAAPHSVWSIGVPRHDFAASAEVRRSRLPPHTAKRPAKRVRESPPARLMVQKRPRRMSRLHQRVFGPP